MKNIVRILLVLIMPIAAGQSLGTAFTYQGELTQVDVLANGNFDFQFELFDSNEMSISEQVAINGVTVVDGKFTVILDFGISPFNGQDVLLEIRVREAEDPGQFTILSPRQNLTATPHALHAATVSLGSITGANIVDGSINSSEIADFGVTTIDIANSAVTQEKIASNSVGGSQIIDSEVQRRVTGTCPPGSFVIGINQDGTLICDSSIPRIIVEKQTVPDGLLQIFQFQGDVAGSLADNGQLSSFQLPGVYASTEVLPLWGWELTDIACDDINSIGDIDSATATYNVEAGETVTCTFTNTRHGAISEVYDPATGFGGAGTYSSLAIGIDGLPIIAARDESSLTPGGELVVVKCNDTACEDGDENIEQFDFEIDWGVWDPSVAVGADNNPIVAYRNESGLPTLAALKILKCDDPECSGSGEVITILDDSAAGRGRWASMALGTDGNPVIAYNGSADDVLMVVKCNDPACIGGDESYSTLNMPGEGGRNPSIVIGSDTFPVISYTGDFFINPDQTTAVFVAKCNDIACAGGDEQITPHSTLSDRSSITIGADSKPVIVGNGGDCCQGLVVVNCDDIACTIGTSVPVDDLVENIRFPSIAIGADGNPVISYVRDSVEFGTDQLKVAKCNDNHCSGDDESITVIASESGIAEFLFTSLAIGSDSNPVISTAECVTPDTCVLKVVHCSLPDCTE